MGSAHRPPYNLRCETRVVLVMLLFIVPFQAAYALAANYCAHEPDAAWHFGHHQHKHAQGDTPDDHATGKLAAGDHADCVGCHVASVGLLVAQTITLNMSPAAISVAREPLDVHSLPPPRPERPQWFAAV